MSEQFVTTTKHFRKLLAAGYLLIACGKQLAEMLGSGNELFAHLLFV